MKLNEEDRIKLVEMYTNAQSTPVIQVAPGNDDLATIAWKRVRQHMIELGKKYDFDPDKIKGIDPTSGEVLMND